MEKESDMATEQSTTPSKPRALVLFAGAAPAVAAASACRLMRLGGLDALFIYHTADWTAKAERLRRFFARQWPALKTVVACEPGEETPMSLASRLRDWRLMRKDVADWTYDLSGAQPPFYAAVSRVVCESGGDIIANAENRAGGPWTRYRADSGGRLIPEDAFDDAPRADEADGADLPSVLELLAEREAEIVWHGSRPPVRLSPREISAIAAAGAENNWSWRESFREATGKSAPIAWDFEDYVASTLVAIGVRNVRVNVTVRIADKPPAEQAYSVVALHNGEVWTFDCRTDANLAEGLDTRPWRLFGQRVVALRPARRATATETILATKRHIILDARDCRSLFDCLASMMSVMLPREFDQVERRALSARATGQLPVFAPASQPRQFSEAIHVAQGVFDIRKGAAADFSGREPPWQAARLADNLWSLSGTLKKQVTYAEGRGRFDGALQHARLGLQTVFFEVAENKLDWCALVRAKDAAAFAKWLSKWENLPLFT